MVTSQVHEEETQFEKDGTADTRGVVLSGSDHIHPGSKVRTQLFNIYILLTS